MQTNKNTELLRAVTEYRFPFLATLLIMALLLSTVSFLGSSDGRSTFKLKKDEWTCTKAVQISTDSTEECLQWSKK